MIRTLARRARDVRDGGALDPEGDWYRSDNGLRKERWVGTGEGYAGDEIVLRPVGVTGQEWLVTTTTVDGDDAVLSGPTDYRTAVDEAESLMTATAQGSIAVEQPFAPAAD